MFVILAQKILIFFWKIGLLENIFRVILKYLYSTGSIFLSNTQLILQAFFGAIFILVLGINYGQLVICSIFCLVVCVSVFCHYVLPFSVEFSLYKYMYHVDLCVFLQVPFILESTHFLYYFPRGIICTGNDFLNFFSERISYFHFKDWSVNCKSSYNYRKTK